MALAKVPSNICYLPMPQADSHIVIAVVTTTENCIKSRDCEWASECKHCKCAFVTGNSIKISSNLICVYSLLESVCAACEVWALNCCYLCCCCRRRRLSDVTFLARIHKHTAMLSFMHIQLPICIEFDMNRSVFSVNHKLLKSLSMAPLCTAYTHRK